MQKEQKYYWLRLKRDFFKRHDIQIIEQMPNGKDYLLFYLKLLCESVDHEGNLRFSEEIPYNEQMLATITNTNIDIVRSAIKVFTGLHMMDILDDGTYHMKEVQKLIGSETYWAQKKREAREKQLAVGNFPTLSNSCPTCPGKSKELELEKELELDINTSAPAQDGNTKTKRFVKPTVDEIREYCEERGNTIDPEQFFDFYESKGWVVGKSPMKDWKSCVRTWERERANKNITLQKEEKPVGSLGNSFDTDESWEAAMLASRRNIAEKLGG